MDSQSQTEPMRDSCNGENVGHFVDHNSQSSESSLPGKSLTLSLFKIRVWVVTSPMKHILQWITRKTDKNCANPSVDHS